MNFYSMSKIYGLECRNPFAGLLNTINQLVGTAETTVFDSSVIPRTEQYLRSGQITDAHFERLGHIYNGLTLVTSNERVCSPSKIVKELSDLIIKEIETVKGSFSNGNASARSYVEKIKAFKFPNIKQLSPEQTQIQEELKDVLKNLDKDLSAGRKQSRIENGTDIESFAYATTLGLTEEKDRVLLLSSDSGHLGLFDLFFGLVYSANFQMANVNNRNHNNAAALFGNPSIRVTKVDMESNTQPYLIARDTNYPDLLGSGFKWKKHTPTSEGQRKDIVNYVRQTINKVLELKKKKEAPIVVAPKEVLEQKLEKTITKEEIKVEKAEILEPVKLVQELKKPELQINNNALIALYNAIGFNKDKVEEKYADGSIEKIVDGYSSLKTIAQATGAVDVLELIKKDEEAIVSFASPITNENIEQLVKEQKLESALEKQKKVAIILKKDDILSSGVSVAKNYLESRVSEYSGKIKSVEEKIVSLGSEINSLQDQRIKLGQESKGYEAHLSYLKGYQVQTPTISEASYKTTPQTPVLSEDPVEKIYQKMKGVIKEHQLEVSLEDNAEVPKSVLKEALGIEHNSNMLCIMKKAKISEDVWPISRGGRKFIFSKDMIKKIAPFCF